MSLSSPNLPESFADPRDAVSFLHQMEDVPADRDDDELEESAASDDAEGHGQDESADTVQGDEEAADDEADDSEQDIPDIDPPVSFSAEAKEFFKKLTPEMQHELARRVSDLEKGTSRQAQQLAEERKALEPVAQRFSQLEQRYVASLETIFNKVLTPELERAHRDWRTATATDPAEAVRLQGVIEQANQWRNYLAQEIHQAQANQQQLAHRDREARIQSEWPRIAEKVPELAQDSARAQPFIDDIVGTMHSYGFAPNELSVTLTDHRYMHFIADAVRALKAQQTRKSALAKKTTAPAPMLMKPNGATNRKQESKNKQVKDANDRLSRSGRIEDAMALLRLT